MKRNPFLISTTLLGAFIMSSSPSLFADDDDTTNGTGGATVCLNDATEDT